MKYAVLVLTLVITACSSDKLRPTPEEGKPCYTADVNTLGVGPCKPGFYVNVDGGLACVNEVTPVDESCNGVDDNCDGVVDRLNRKCFTACDAGIEYCRDGTWYGCTAPQPQEESCNDKDDDCDGVRDNNVPIRPCYSGNTDELAHGECRFGVTRCAAGLSYCYAEVLPKPEVCNGQDDNCNGQIDDSAVGGMADIVLIVDNSCSMGTLWTTAQIALVDAINAHSWGAYRYAVVGAPDMDLLRYDDDVSLYHDLDYADAGIAAVQAQDGMSGTGAEPTTDAVYLVGHIANPLGISWRPGSKRTAIVFSDEIPQSFMSPNVTPEQAVASARTTSLTVHVFTKDMVASIWRRIPDGTGGQLLSLEVGSIEMTEKLNAIFDGASCR